MNSGIAKSTTAVETVNYCRIRWWYKLPPVPISQQFMGHMYKYPLPPIQQQGKVRC